ncbi:hypothetical protein CK501_08610 [Halovibrio salipaludis]|uniref:DUF2946 domain-containing protein n=1 Tax=Halovibrio salipaludis TaxID=2032626 RepID=A0A2A2F6Y7_9GAMM|nr:DUF2946 family protein [Halovibrio salipaludis]PAU80494.1 hypothetical protein CK501_08610 [Halovibrio salipaludis]
MRYACRAINVLLLLALAFRIAVPAGFMPAPVSGHGAAWLVPCPSDATSAEWLAGLSGKQAHHEHGDHSAHAAFEACEFGSFSTLNAPTEAVASSLGAPALPTDTRALTQPLYKAPYPRAGRTRAPPV